MKGIKTPESVLWEIVLKAEDFIDMWARMESEMTEKMTEFYHIRNTKLTSDMVLGLGNQTARDAEVSLQMELEPITREYGLAKIKCAEMEKKWRYFELVSKACEALIYSRKKETIL